MHEGTTLPSLLDDDDSTALVGINDPLINISLDYYDGGSRCFRLRWK